MAIITKIKRADEIIEKGVDKIFKNKYKGAPGTEIKKLKAIGERLKKGKKDKKLIDQSGKI